MNHAIPVSVFFDPSPPPGCGCERECFIVPQVCQTVPPLHPSESFPLKTCNPSRVWQTVARMATMARTRILHPGRRARARLDQALVERGWCESREKAQRAVMAGRVLVNQRVARKPSDPVKPEDAIVLAEA